jgi:phosphatidylglycerol:prolipoprotein diacylglycerol transferase
MYRYLLRIGPISVYAYGAMLALAFIVGTYLAVKRGKRQGIESTKIVDLSLYILVSSILGARILYVVLNWNYYKENILDVLKLWEGGLVFYGGLLTAFFTVDWVLKRNKLSVDKVADILSAPIALGIAIGRIGCFLNGCCYGKISYKWGICFPAVDNPLPFTQQAFDGLIPFDAQCTLPVLPTQLYESVACLLIFFLLLWLERHKHFPGFSFWMFILLYSFSRFIIEGMRYYDANFIWGAFTVSQVISVGLFICALTVLVMGARRTGLRKT